MNEKITRLYGLSQIMQVCAELVGKSIPFSLEPLPHSLFQITVKEESSFWLPAAIGQEILAYELERMIDGLNFVQIAHENPLYIDFEQVVAAHDPDKGTAGTYTGLKISVVVENSLPVRWYFQLLVNDEVTGWDEGENVPVEYFDAAGRMLMEFQVALDKLAGKTSGIRLDERSCSHTLGQLSKKGS